MLWCCWLGSRKGIQPVKNWVVRYWHGCLSGARCKWFVYGPADATATPSSLAPVKSRMVYLSGAAYPGCPGKRPLNGCSSSTYMSLYLFKVQYRTVCYVQELVCRMTTRVCLSLTVLSVTYLFISDSGILHVHVLFRSGTSWIRRFPTMLLSRWVLPFSRLLSPWLWAVWYASLVLWSLLMVCSFSALLCW